MKTRDTIEPVRFPDAQVCVVWHPCHRPPAPELLRALANKGMTLIDADDPHTAFAAACIAARDAARVILLLDDREALPCAREVVGALPRFAPRVLCWAHTPGANPPITPLVQPQKTTRSRANPPSAHEQRNQSRQQPAQKGEQAPTQPAKRTPGRDPQPEPASAEPPLRLVRDTQPETQPGAVSTPERPLSTRDVLDADELDALLASELSE